MAGDEPSGGAGGAGLREARKRVFGVRARVCVSAPKRVFYFRGEFSVRLWLRVQP
ncbi:protein of unknown function [Paraburkholderia dioscoreae]|uniref:Uncharacterized protein n=1 Tax=Paraburkholderia dioscoreae TaxID=2604047 RepID=A0A5Q4Z7M5_9BURK|nr:protein of unknown function [Paraburkholderia dioscoreae]